MLLSIKPAQRNNISMQMFSFCEKGQLLAIQELFYMNFWQIFDSADQDQILCVMKSVLELIFPRKSDHVQFF